MSPRRLDPPLSTDEPDTKRWPRAWRLIFLFLAGAACWVVVVILARFVWRRMGL